MASVEIANLKNILIIYNPDDGKDWKDYLKEEIKKYFNNEIEIFSVQDRKLPPLVEERKPSEPGIIKMNYGPIKRPAMLLVLSTPKHRDYMLANPLISYKQALILNYFIFQPENCVIYFCNTFPSELKQPDADGVMLEKRFEEFSKWKQFNSEDNIINLTKFTETVFNKIKKEIDSKIHPKAKIINNTAKCQGPTTVVVAFEQALPDKAIIQTYLGIHSLPKGIEVKTEILNPYTITFLTFEHVEGDVDVLITVNGNEVSLEQRTITFVSAANDVNSVSQIYIILMNKLIELTLKNGTSLSTLDCQLSNMFQGSEMDPIPFQAFEVLFGVFQAISEESSDFQFPTLIHLAAHYGLKELMSRLFDLPDAKLILSISNNKEETPEMLAREMNHIELANFLENMREGELQDIYMKFIKKLYVNDMDDIKLKSEIKRMRMKGKALDTAANNYCSARYLEMKKINPNKSKTRSSKEGCSNISDTLNELLGKDNRRENDIAQTLNHCEDLISRSHGTSKSFQEKEENAKKMKTEVTKIKKNIEGLSESLYANEDEGEIYYAVNTSRSDKSSSKRVSK